MRPATSFTLVLGAATAVALFTACSGAGSRALPPVGPAEPTLVGQSRAQPFTAGPPPSPGALVPVGPRSPWLEHLTANIPLNVAVLYVSGATCACVLVYSQRGTDQAPIGMIGGMSDARGLFVDHEGDLYVGNSLADTVPIYEEGQLTAPVETLTDPGNHPSDIVRDGYFARSTIYVVNQNTDQQGPGSISVYVNGSTTPSYYLNTHPNTFLDSITLDSQHNLFAGYGDPEGVAHIDEFKKGSRQPIQLPTQLGYTGGMEIDNTDDLLVADPDFFTGQNNPAVDILSIGSPIPEHQFDMEGWPYYVALNKKEYHVYVSDAKMSQIREYKYPEGILIDTITKGLENGNYPVGVAVAHPGPL